MQINAGIRSQIKQLKDRLKALNTKKHKPADVKSLLDDLEALEKRYEQEKAKREEKRKLKEKENEKASETPKETSEERKETPKENVEANESASVEKEAVPDIMPETGTNWPEVLKDKEYKPMEHSVKKEIVKNVEKKLGPAIIGNKYNIDDKVMPIRGEKSVGRVMRHDMYVKHKETGKEGIVISHE